MKNKLNLLAFLIVLLVLAIAGTAVARSNSGDELAAVREATVLFKDPEAAQAAGWDLVEGLDHCFDNPGVGAMGFHYINTALLDTSVDALEPEAMVYEPMKNGKLKLVAVEYIVPAGPWDEQNSEFPSLFGRNFHLNADLGVYVLHAWIWRNNPAGMFEDWNPQVSCP